MTDPQQRLYEARKQIRLAVDDITNDELVDRLERAEGLVEGVRGDMIDGTRDP